MMKILLIAGARPNFMKIAPIYRAAVRYGQIKCKIVHTGQHYDYDMSEAFFEDLELPKPDFSLMLKDYAFFTLHRPSNVDTRSGFSEIAEALNTIADKMPILFPVHPRTKKMMDEFNLHLSDNISFLSTDNDQRTCQSY